MNLSFPNYWGLANNKEEIALSMIGTKSKPNLKEAILALEACKAHKYVKQLSIFQ